jgi:hypothetical protein
MLSRARLCFVALLILCVSLAPAHAQFHNGANFASTTASNNALNNTTTPITFSVATANNWPAAPFYAVVDPNGTPERITVTATTGTSWTATRDNPTAHLGTPRIICSPVWDYFAELQTAITGLAPIASPTFTGTVTLPSNTIGVTQSGGDNSTKVATTAYVDTAVGGIVGVSHHGARVYRSTSMIASNNTLTTIPFDSERSDTDAYHDTSSNTSRLTIGTGLAGRYSMGCTVNFDANSGGASRYTMIELNGTTVLAIDQRGPVANEIITTISTVFSLAEGDYIEVAVFQDSGGGLSLLPHDPLDFGGGVTRVNKAGLEFWLEKLN